MSNTLTYIFADDDEVYKETTLQQLRLLPQLECLAICENALEVSEKLLEHQPDLLILDVEMPGLSGIELVKSLTKTPMIIFITSHANYAADAFEVDAIDFLVKPVAMHRLMRSVEKARSLQEMKAAIPAGDGFKRSAEEAFYIKDKNVFTKINYSDVLYIESLGDFVNIFLEGGTKKIALVSLKALEQQLPQQFFLRISRTHMINRQRLTAIDNSQVSLGRIQLPVGKTFSETVMHAVVSGNLIRRFI